MYLAPSTIARRVRILEGHDDELVNYTVLIPPGWAAYVNEQQDPFLVHDDGYLTVLDPEEIDSSKEELYDLVTLKALTHFVTSRKSGEGEHDSFWEIPEGAKVIEIHYIGCFASVEDA